MTYNSIMDKARKYQEQLTCNRYARKKAKEQHYQEFLATTNRNLPSYKSLRISRNIILFIDFILFSIIALLIFKQEWNIVIFEIPTVFILYLQDLLGLAILVLGGFAGAFDWAIYKRFKKGSLIQW